MSTAIPGNHSSPQQSTPPGTNASPGQASTSPTPLNATATADTVKDIKLDDQTLPAIRNLVKHKYRGDAKRVFNDYSDTPETPIPVEVITLMLRDSGLNKDIIAGEAKSLVKKYDSNDDGLLTIEEFDRLITGV